MKRAAAGLLLFFFASVGFADATSTYVVALKRHSFVRPTVLIGDTPAMDVQEFPTLNAFSAELTDQEVASLRRSGQVRYVERAVDRHALGVGSPAPTAVRTYFGQSVPYGIEMVHAPEVWKVTRGQSINVVVVDTGIDYHHPDLAGVYVGGFNPTANNDDPMDDHGHGTHVAGTIAAADNNIGVIGVAPQVRLWGVKVLKADGHGSTADIIAAVDWVIQKKRALGGNWVMNLSLGSDESNVAEQEAFQRATDEGILACAASGNESDVNGAAPVGFPAAYQGVLSIGAITESRVVANFSNQGPEMSLVAPGVRVLSLARTGSTSIGAVQTPGFEIAARGITGSPKATVTGKLVYCGSGDAGAFSPVVAGNIALIQREGTLTLNQRARNAKAAGAAAVIIFGAAIDWTFLVDSDPSAATFEWPLSIAVTKEEGEVLRRDESAAVTVTFREDDYVQRNGTSMATPHAAGVAALVWSLAPSAPASAVRLALIDTAADLGEPGFDSVFGFGVVDALSAGKALAPGAFLSPATVPSGRRTLKRGP